MSLFEDESEYIEVVRDRAMRQIDCNVWEGIQRDRLTGWFGSLRNIESELLGAYLLDNLCYRSRGQYSAMLDALFMDLFMPGGMNGALLVDEMRGKRAANPSRGACLAPVIGHLAPPTKSGPYILRLVQRRFQLHSDWLVWPHFLGQASEVTDLYFVDDFCGTGDQFDKFLKGIQFDRFMQANPKVNVSYLVTTIHTKGRDRIVKDYPNIQLKWSELLDNSHSVLDASCLGRYQVNNFAEKITAQYVRAVKSLGLPQGGRFADGFGELGLAYAFAHATPNNTLPIFWMGTQNLTPLLDR
jgi:hypothetical protein